MIIVMIRNTTNATTFSKESRPSEKGSSGLSQSNHFREHSRRKQQKAKLGILGGAKVSGSWVLIPSRVRIVSEGLLPFVFGGLASGKQDSACYYHRYYYYYYYHYYFVLYSFLNYYFVLLLPSFGKLGFNPLKSSPLKPFSLSLSLHIYIYIYTHVRGRFVELLIE